MWVSGYNNNLLTDASMCYCTGISRLANANRDAKVYEAVMRWRRADPQFWETKGGPFTGIKVAYRGRNSSHGLRPVYFRPGPWGLLPPEYMALAPYDLVAP
jgi:hypothetical protein